MTSDMNYRILIIEDDQRMASMLSEYLGFDGYESTIVNRVSDFYPELLQEHQLVLLDLMLGQDSGFELLKIIRQQCNIPVIVVSAKNEDSDKLIGFKLGADDYLTKPYNHLELIARIQAVLKRANTQEQTHKIFLNNFAVNFESQQLLIDDQNIELTSLEFRILALLLDQPGKVVNRDHIYKQALMQPYEFSSRALDVHMSNLRKKLGSYHDQEQIKTIRGQGYMLLKLEEMQ